MDRAHLVAGFGRVHWVDSAEFLLPKVPVALAEAEPDILAHMNSDHTDAIRLYATVLLGLPDQDGWTMTGIDPEGCDLRNDRMIARVDFDQRVEDPASARVALAGLARRARETGAGGRGAGQVGAPYA